MTAVRRRVCRHLLVKPRHDPVEPGAVDVYVAAQNHAALWQMQAR
jgi:hypothetical protein